MTSKQDWLEMSIQSTPELVEPLSELFQRYGDGGVVVQLEGDWDPDNDQNLLECISLDKLFVEGLMTIGPVSQNKDSTIKAFSLLREIKEKINRQIEKEKELAILSMGMSNDFELGIFEGSTMVRLGTSLFGPRE